ncbi:DUF6415 family natural product biosynthesis protein [Streptomyces kronopolitis]|uniref:DUF6415 family natural product biosynthesis protein n=1 Tax=Streptomyces kronopolitis TaxID=1612435 RepID=UPI003434F504
MSPTPETPPAQSHQALPLDVETMQRTVRVALQYGRTLPPHQEVEALTSALRGHLEEVLATMAPMLARGDRATREWSQARTLHDHARHQIAADPGPGLQSAAAHMKALALTLHNLTAMF